MEGHLSSCLDHLNIVNNSDVGTVNSVTTKDVLSSCCEARDSSHFHPTSDKQNLSSTEPSGGDLATGRHCVEAFPGHQKDKRILEVKEF